MALALLLTLLCSSPASAAGTWRALYEAGRWHPGTTAWIGDGTHSQRTPEGLLVADNSTDKGSGRFYQLNWQADSTKGAELEAKVRAVSCSQPWGAGMMVSDGIHEEGLTLFPDRLLLVNAKQDIPLDAAGAFHVLRMVIRGEDIQVFVDGELRFDGKGRFATPAECTPPRNQCGFGCGASSATGEAIWEYVRFRSDLLEEAPPMQPNVPGLKVSVGETVELAPDATYVSLFRFRDGRLAAAGKLSSDGGKTWTPGAGPGTASYEFPDGEIISLGFMPKKLSDGVFEVGAIRSTDGGKTFVGESARLNIPEATGGTGDDGKYYEAPPVDHAIVQCRDGSLLAAMYGYFKTDTVLCPAFPPEWKVYKYRTWVMRSTDRGRTWDYWATVAYDPSVGAESFCEADLLTLPSGRILCFMRTGGSPPKFVTPLHLSHSDDDGRTWSTPRPIADRGVWPNACRMADGTLVVTYGRPDNWLAFSLDDGETWVGHFSFHQGPSTNYNTVEEVAPGRLLVVYDARGLDENGNMASGARGTFVEVSR